MPVNNTTWYYSENFIRKIREAPALTILKGTTNTDPSFPALACHPKTGQSVLKPLNPDSESDFDAS